MIPVSEVHFEEHGHEKTVGPDIVDGDGAHQDKEEEGKSAGSPQAAGH